MTSAQVLDRLDAEVAGRAVGYCFGSSCREDDGLTGPGGVFASLDDMIAWDLALRRGTLVEIDTLLDATAAGYGLGWRRVTRNARTSFTISSRR
jgi:hypothetical protein